MSCDAKLFIWYTTNITLYLIAVNALALLLASPVAVHRISCDGGYTPQGTSCAFAWNQERGDDGR